MIFPRNIGPAQSEGVESSLGDIKEGEGVCREWVGARDRFLGIREAVPVGILVSEQPRGLIGCFPDVGKAVAISIGVVGVGVGEEWRQGIRVERVG